MMLLDVDHFKQFNDTHGHLAGDEVLRCVGQTLAKTVKAGDLACRYGGEEFAIIMSNTKSPDAQIAVERVRKAIEAMQVQFAGKTLRVTASIGMAESQRDEDAVRLVRRADDAVYASKKAGRNCSHWHNGDGFVPISSQANPAQQPAVAPKPTIGVRSSSTAHLPDRAVFTDELRRRVAESQRFGMPLSVIQFRVKDYAQLELTYGDGVGALLLDALAIFIRSTLRDMDLLGKLEGGQFVVMLPGSSAGAAKIVGQRVKASISLCPIPLGDQQIRLHLDMGVADVNPGDNAQSAMANAEAAMEAAAAAEVAERQSQAELAVV
jgi:diguanylate cyclase (GGDEF)-like protein